MPAPARYLGISADQLTSLARGRDHPGIASLLRRAWLSRNLTFFAALSTAPQVSSTGNGQSPLDTLIRAQRVDRAAVDSVLTHPRFGAWAAYCATAAPGRGQFADPIGFAASFAVAAALRAGIEFALPIPVVGGVGVVPGLGTVSGADGAYLPVQGRHGRLELDGGQTWNPVRTWRSGDSTFEFDDLPPTPSAWPDQAVAPRWMPIADTEYGWWKGCFDTARQLLDDTVPELARPLTHGMRAVVPRSHENTGFVTSTLVDAFGAAAMITPVDGIGLATGLLHEFQHSKLGIVLELVPMIACDTEVSLPSPWRTGPRPPSAVLHGVYAHLAVGRFTRGLASSTGSAELAERADTAHRQTVNACAALLDSGTLTEIGHTFVTVLRRTVDDDARAVAAMGKE
ncbi:aKG-HExxH-type peptide beta-hydroxylase [Nocardia sp. IBHARD005]|uniref:aKG-HExxH-type peptide beta-hydroxylase n=1 Tax=Nocardia sp. IBHARD005 TaxID=3457765 RepID=UPI004059B8DC